MSIQDIASEFYKYTGIQLNTVYQYILPNGAANAELFQKFHQFFELGMEENPMIALKEDLIFYGKNMIKFPKEYYRAEIRKFRKIDEGEIEEKGGEEKNPIVIE